MIPVTAWVVAYRARPLTFDAKESTLARAMTTSLKLLSAAEKLDWLRLIRSENVGPITFYRLLEHFGSAGAALKNLPDIARRGGWGRPITVCSKAAAVREMEALERLGAWVIARGEPDYPPPLAAIEDGPPLLLVRGHAHILQRPAIAIVGARNASLNGCKLARQIAADLSTAEVLVISGLARGIDACAHEGALSTGEGGTVAVNAGGVDVVYPAENGVLYERIMATGAVVSEMPPGENPQARHFPRRNRIVSGLAVGVVVVEATARSGSLITARLALEQGREVFAVPGSPLDPRAAGPNRLIRDGATLVERADDVLQEMERMRRTPFAVPAADRFVAPPPAPPEEAELAAARAMVLESLGPAPVAVDEIIRRCQLSPSMVSLILLELELAGRIERQAGHQVALLG
ncbi:MAG: DNA processing protein [Rhodospirillaceae bacterium]|nr:MAG: DNA processing protein [Rhodospirillaceae bacterium]